MMSPTDKPWYPLLEKAGNRKVYHAGDAILLQDEISSHIGLIISGRAKALSYSASGDETWLGFFEPGDFLGHMSYFSGLPINYEISAETELSTLLMPISAVKRLIEEADEFGHSLSEDLAQRLDQMMRRLVEAYTLSAKGRVCAELARLSSPMGVDAGRDVIRPSPVFVDIALRINSTRETVSRTVSELQKKGILSRSPGALIVDQPERLRDGIK